MSVVDNIGPWPQQASLICGNFSDTSFFILQNKEDCLAWIGTHSGAPIWQLTCPGAKSLRYLNVHFSDVHCNCQIIAQLRLMLLKLSL
jgi:hypothetical protein